MIKNYFFGIVIIMFGINLNAQTASGSFGSTYVPSDGFISIFSDHSFDFADCGLFPGLLLTERTGNPGVINFTATSSWNSASDDSHIDGYARTFSSGPFAFPVGDDGRVRLIGISGSANTRAAYVFEDPSLFTGVMTISNPDLDAVSTREYWFLNGSNATDITVTWDQFSNVEDLVSGDISKLTLIGWDGNNWVVIPSAENPFTLQLNSQNIFDENISTSFSIGSITSTSPVIPDDFQLITLGSLTTPRSSLVEKGDLKIFPNPAKLGSRTFVSYNLIGNMGKMEIYDSYNNLVYTELLQQSKGIVNLPQMNLSDDRYVVTLIEQDGSKKSKYLIVIK